MTTFSSPMAEGARSGWVRLGDGVCIALVVLAQLTSASILLATVVYVVWVASVTHGEFIELSWEKALWLLSYLGTIFAGQRLRQHIARRPERRWAHAWFLGLALLALMQSFSWFRDPMHDIGRAFGSHGRWGCAVIDDDGSYYYTLNDHSVPLILFGPVVLVVALRGLVTERQGIRAWLMRIRARVPAGRLRLASWAALTLAIAVPMSETVLRLGTRPYAVYGVGIAFVSGAISALVVWLLTLLLRAWLVAAG